MKLIGLVLVWAVLTNVAEAADMTIKVVDAKGRPVARFEILTAGRRYNQWWSRERLGIAQLTGVPEASSFDVVVRCDGFATAVERFPLQSMARREGTATIVLQRGIKVELKICLEQGTELHADYVPSVFFDDYIL